MTAATFRENVRDRPAGCPVLHQRWSRLVFLHWRFRPDLLRSLVPGWLALDLFEDQAWVGLTAFTVSRMRPTFLPPLPWLGSACEINLRTYVHRDGVPGLWFFSLDADNAPAVWGARATYHLPYYFAHMRVRDRGDTVSFHSRRSDSRAPAAAEFDAAWHLGDRLPAPQPASLDFFLVERYVLFSAAGARRYRARIHHRPWPLRRAAVTRLESTLLAAAGLRAEDGPPLVHAQAQPLDVSIWAPERVA